MDYQALILSFLITAICVGFLGVLKKYHLDVQVSSTSIFLSLVLFYLVFSGSLTEFSVLGIDAKLKAVVANPIDESAIDQTDILGQDSLDKDLNMEVFFGVPQRVIAVDGDAWMELGENEKHNKWRQIRNSIYQSLLAGQFLGLVVTDKQKKPEGVFGADNFLDLLRIPIEEYKVKSTDQKYVLSKQEIITRSQQTNLYAVLLNPIYRVRQEGSNISARFDAPLSELLDLVSKHRVELIILTDFNGEYLGIVTASKIQLAILQKLTSDS